MSSVIQLLDSWSKPRHEAWLAEIEVSLRTESAAWLAVADEGSLTSDRWWLLLSWVEDMASVVAATARAELVELAAFALSVLEDGPIDPREAWLVGGLLRCGAKRADLDFLSLIRTGCERAGTRGERCRTWLSRASDRLPPTHREVGQGTDFRFERPPAEPFDEAAFIRRLNGER